jgi:hypothetical protein
VATSMGRPLVPAGATLGLAAEGQVVPLAHALRTSRSPRVVAFIATRVAARAASAPRSVRPYELRHRGSGAASTQMGCVTVAPASNVGSSSLCTLVG